MNSRNQTFIIFHSFFKNYLKKHYLKSLKVSTDERWATRTAFTCLCKNNKEYLPQSFIWEFNVLAFVKIIKLCIEHSECFINITPLFYFYSTHFIIFTNIHVLGIDVSLLRDTLLVSCRFYILVDQFLGVLVSLSNMLSFILWSDHFHVLCYP